MQLRTFRITHFRSIDDSGEIELERITPLLGRNESGKSNLLLALHSLNPPSGVEALIPIKDFPRHRHLNECSDRTPVVTTRWTLTEPERRALTERLPRANGVTEVVIRRDFGGQRQIEWVGLKPLKLDPKALRRQLRKVTAQLLAAAEALGPEAQAALQGACERFEQAAAPNTEPKAWAEAANKAVRGLRVDLTKAELELTDKQEAPLVQLEERIDECRHSDDQEAAAAEWLYRQLPVFIYLDDYPELNGHHHLGQYLKRQQQGHPTVADRYFGKLCQVAGLSPETLQQLLTEERHDLRNQLVNRASAVVTERIRTLWRERELKIRFNLDGEYLDTYVADPNARYDVEVNLDERSRGFRWFFSFYVTFAADAPPVGEALDAAPTGGAILLLDEPGLYLHACTQGDLLRHLREDFSNQVVYTTHSPFMISPQALQDVRTVAIDQERGTLVSNSPSGDPRTLFPLQAALGYDLAQSLFGDAHYLIVEAISDYWLLSALSHYFEERGEIALRRELTVIPMGGAGKIAAITGLLTAQSAQGMLLLSDRVAIRQRLAEHAALFGDSGPTTVLVSAGFESEPPPAAELEDLLEPEYYLELVKESYATALSGKTLLLDPAIYPITERVERAFNDVGLRFSRTQPARLLLRKLARAPQQVVNIAAEMRFKRLFFVINRRWSKTGASPPA